MALPLTEGRDESGLCGEGFWAKLVLTTGRTALERIGLVTHTMNQDLVTLVRCDQCGLGCHPRDRFCRGCGVPLTAVAAELAEPPRRNLPANPPVHALLNNRLAVMGILACVGPLGLPLLWLSHRFSRRTKIITTVAFFIVTIVLPIAVTYYCMEIALQPLLEIFERPAP